ncbi:hypothetical protein FPV67DRAFT_1784183 [Lyophyllum atratum]|nr:hypothetical protein FPV67DRAFT_1784183 [Lyophyllum atratum]
MHPCLAIPDLQSRIFEHLPTIRRLDCLDSDIKVICTHNLANLARTCRAFTEPALSILWRNQATLGPLIQVMPSDMWRVVTRKDGERTVTFNFVPEDAEWARFEHYAWKIHTLGFHRHEHSLPIHHDVMLTLASYRPARCILPNLRKITFQMNDSENKHSLIFAQCLLSSTIQRVLLRINADQYGGCTLISAIRRNCPNIQELSIRLYGSPPSALVSALTDLMCALPRLETLSTDFPIQMDTLLHLSILPSLGTLHAGELVFDNSQSIKLLASQDNRFARLHTLLFTVASFEEATSVMHAVHHPLSKLAVKISQTAASMESNNFITHLTQHPCHHWLRHLLIGTSGSPNDTDSLNDIHSIYALFLLPEIEALELDCKSFAAAVDDIWLATAAVTWPRLSTIVIRGRTKSTLAGLMPLVIRCPLERIGIDAVWTPFDLRRLDPVVGNIMIDVIVVDDATIEGDILAVLRCLLAMFPRLALVGKLACDFKGGPWDKLQKALNRSLRF